MAKKKKKGYTRSDLGTFLTTPSGRAILWRMLEGFGVFRSSFSQDPLVMAFREGQRNEGLRLLQEIQMVSLDDFLMMWKENSNGGKDRNNPDNNSSGSTGDDSEPDHGDDSESDNDT